MRPFDRPYLLLTLTALMWAGNAVAGRMAPGHVSPFMLTSLRWALACLILLAFTREAIRRDWPVIVANWPFLAFCGAIGFALFNELLYLALNYTTAINVAIEQAAMPLVVFALNWLFLRIATSGLQMLGFVLTLAGVVITVTRGQPLSLLELPVNFGDAVMLLAVLAYGIYSVALVRKPAIHWQSFITVAALFALAASLPFTAWEIVAGRAVWPDAEGWAITLYTALLPSIAAQVFWVRGLELIGSNRGGVFINIVPIFTAALAVAMLGERFHAYHAVALALVIAGVWLSQRRPAAPRRGPTGEPVQIQP